MQHILIVEDDLDIQDLLRIFLQEVGYKTTIASDGMEAIALFFASTFWKKLQSIFGECCISKLEKVAKPRLAAILPVT